MPDATAPEELPRLDSYLRQREHTSIELKVLEKIGHRAALSVPGVIRHSSGIGQWTGRRLPRVTVHMDYGERVAVADVQIATAWPAPTVAVAQVTRETVAEWIEHMTGVPVLAVNVGIAAVVPVDDTDRDGGEDSSRVTLDDLAAAPRSPEITRVTAEPLPVTFPETTRTVDEPFSPDVPEHPALVSPAVPDAAPTVAVTRGRPPRPRHVTAPAVPSALRPADPPRHRLRPVAVPSAPEVLHPVTPPSDEVVRPRPPYTGAQGTHPRPLIPVDTAHRDVTVPPKPAGLPLLFDVPTPRGLPTRTVPTPDGLPVTVFPQVRRTGLTPVTVDRSRRHGRSSS